MTDLMNDATNTRDIFMIGNSFLTGMVSFKKDYCNDLQLNELRLLSGNLCLFDKMYDK